MKLKHIAAAAALIAASAPSFALLNLGGDSDNPDMVAFVFDRTAQVSYAIDLGLGLTDFNQNSSYSFNLNSANFASFLSAAGGAGGLEFAVYTGENFGGTSAGARNILTTVTAGSTVALSNQSVGTAVGNTAAAFFGNVVNNSVGSTFATVNNGDGWAAAGSTAYFLNQPQDKWNVPAINFTNTNLEGTSAAFYKLTNSSTSNGAAATVTALAGVWTLTPTAGQTYSLQYSAVPDADGLALMLAGLGAMGFIARRRAAK